jgi:hypothetical protein
MSKRKTTIRKSTGGIDAAGREVHSHDGAHKGDEMSAGLDHYLGHVAHLDMPIEMKIALIRSLHEMMQSFVDRAFGDDPVQLALDRDKQNKTDTDQRPNVLKSEADAHNSSSRLGSGFRRNAGPHKEKVTDR